MFYKHKVKINITKATAFRFHRKCVESLVIPNRLNIVVIHKTHAIPFIKSYFLKNCEKYV